MRKWNVFVENVNAKKIETYNIFNHYSFAQEIDKYLAGEINAEELQRQARYCFSYKCEYEVIITGWPNEQTYSKVDVYHQLMLNWDAFLYYINSEKFCTSYNYAIESSTGRKCLCVEINCKDCKYYNSDLSCDFEREYELFTENGEM